MPKKVLSVRLDDDLRGKLEFIAEREYRTLANQITLFLLQSVSNYFSDENAYDAYMKDIQARVFKEQFEAEQSSKLEEIPF